MEENSEDYDGLLKVVDRLAVESQIHLSHCNNELARIKVEDGERMVGFAASAVNDMESRKGILLRAVGYYEEAVKYFPKKEYEIRLKDLLAWVEKPESMPDQDIG